MKISMNNITDDLIEEFGREYFKEDENQNFEVYPKQSLYQYQLFLLEKGIYGTKNTESKSEEITPEGDASEISK